MITTVKTEVLSKRRILKYYGVSAKEIPHYEEQCVWVDLGPTYENQKTGKLVKGSRFKLVKDQPCKSGRNEKVRKIVSEFEERENAVSYYIMLTRADDKQDDEVVILYVKPSELDDSVAERQAVQNKTPAAYICKLHQPEVNTYARISCDIEEGHLYTNLILNRCGGMSGGTNPRA